MLTQLPALRAQTPEWKKLPPIPVPVGGFAVGVTGEGLIVAGGTNWEGGQKNWLTSVYCLDLGDLKWSTLAPLPQPMAYGVTGRPETYAMAAFAMPAPKPDGTRAPCILIPHRVFRFAGGSTGTAGFISQAGFETTSGQPPGRISQKGLPADHAVVLAAGGEIDGRLIFAGGSNDAANIAGLTRTTFALDSKGQIEPLPDYPGKPFGIAAAAVVDGALHVFGGTTSLDGTQAPLNLDDAYAFTLATKTWRKLKPLPFKVRGMTAVSLGNVIYLGGGYRSDPDSFTADTFIYDPKKDEYRPSIPLPYVASVGLVSDGQYVYCLGGEDKMKSRTAQCYRIPVAELLK